MQMYSTSTHTHVSTHTRKNIKTTSQWWCTPLTPALGRQRQADLCEFKVSLVYRGSSRTAKGYIKKLCPEKPKQTNKQTKTTTLQKELQINSLPQTEHPINNPQILSIYTNDARLEQQAKESEESLGKH